jgi:hypothetical protein
MKRSWVLTALIPLLALALGGCLRSVEVNPEDLGEDAELVGHVKVTDKTGIEYKAQSLMNSEDGESFLLQRVDVVNDGVKSQAEEYLLPKDQVKSIEYYKTNGWVVFGLVVAVGLFMVFLYYKINTDVFD